MADAGIGIYQVAVNTTLAIMLPGAIGGLSLPGVGLSVGGGAIGGAFVGGTVGFIYGGLTGEGSWDWQKTTAGAISGAMIGASIGLSITGGTGLAVSIVSGALTQGGIAGFGSFQGGQTVNWSQWGTATGIGLVTGAVGGALSYGLAQVATAAGLCSLSLIPQLAAKFAVGFVEGAATNAVFQGLNIWAGNQPEGFSVAEMLVAGGTSGVMNALLGVGCFRLGTRMRDDLGFDKQVEDFRDAETFGESCDRIWTRDEYNPHGPLVRRRVLRKRIGSAHLLQITVRGQIIDTTANHLFYVTARTEFDEVRALGWTPAGSLRPGDILSSHDDERVMVEGVADLGVMATVCNLEVEDCHTYFVGGDDWGFSVWAHNAGCAPGPKTDPNAPHNATIRALAGALKSLGNTILAGGGELKEKLIKTAGGFLSGRRPDILYQTPSGEIRAINVGLTNAGGTPVTREVQALADLNGRAGVPTMFVPYVP